MKKLFAIVMVVAMMLSMSVVASAGQSATIDYDAETKTAVITVSTTEAFETIDAGVVSEATCKVVAQVVDFAMNNAMDPSITYSAATNAAATDEAGNTYAVATGAGYKLIDPETSEPIPYVGAVYTFTYENVEEGTEFTVVTGTASAKDITAAEVVTTLKAEVAGEETPVPTEDVPTPTEDVPTPTEDVPTPTEDVPTPTEDDKKDDVEATDKPVDEGKKPAPQTADVAPVATMITLVVVAGLAIVALKKRATN